jgi:imidazolonepropionase-like amidohydrolase
MVLRQSGIWGGNTFGLKMAIDQGIVEGPRIYPSGGVITQTAGHVDFRTPNQKHPRFGGTEPAYESEGHAYIVDGVPLVLAAARENLRHGASQIKLAAGGGYASPADPLWGDQFTFEEIKAAADAAGDWGTYVTIHSYHPSAINKGYRCGCKGYRSWASVGQSHLAENGRYGSLPKYPAFHRM